LNFKDSYNDAREFILSGKTHEHLKLLQNVWEHSKKNYR